MTRIRRITLVATGQLVPRLLAVRHRLSWLGVPVAGTVLAAGLATAPAASAASAAPEAGVSLAQVGNDLLFAGQGSDHNEIVYYQTVGSSSWSEVGATSAGTVYSRASIADLTEVNGAQTYHLIGMVAEGPDDTLNFWWQWLSNIGSGQWNQEALGGAGTAIAAPSIVQIGNDVAVVSEGANNSFNFFWQQIGSSGWNTDYNQDEGLVYGDPTMAHLTSPPDTLGIAFSYLGGSEDYAQQTTANFSQGWPEASFFGYSGTGTISGPTITGLDDGVTAITALCTGNSLCSWTTTDPPYNFSLTTDQAFPDEVFSNVSVAVLGGGVVAAASEGNSFNLNFYWRSYNGGPWQIEDLSSPGTDLSPPQVIALANLTGTQMAAIATEGTNYSADLYWQIVGSSTWQTVAFPAGTFGA